MATTHTTVPGQPGVRIIDGQAMYSAAWLSPAPPVQLPAATPVRLPLAAAR